MVSDTSAKHHPFVQFLYLFLLVLAGVVFASAIGGVTILKASGTVNGVLPTPDATNIYAFKWAQAAYTTIGFLLPACLFARVVMRNSSYYLPVHDPGKPLLLLLVFLLMVVSMPMMEWFIVLNKSMKLPGFLKGLERWILEMENQNAAMTEAFLLMPDTYSLIFNLVLVALLPALAEEFLFRGCIQSIFENWFKNVHLAVWVTAALFSFIHMQFYGFLPRMALGVMFGYLVVWSGSLWPSVLAHLFNNAFAVVASYLYQHQLIKMNLDSEAVFPFFSYLISLALTVLVLILYRKFMVSEAGPELNDGAELD